MKSWIKYFLIGIVIILVLFLFYLFSNRNKITFKEWENVSGGSFDLNEYGEYEDFVFKKDKILDTIWINDSTLEVRASISVVCVCGNIINPGYEINNGKIILYYTHYIDDESMCADCIFPQGISFILTNLTKANYNVELKRR